MLETSIPKTTGNTVRMWYHKETGLLHRDSGPAVEWADGTKVWYQHGKRHRVDGPALEFNDGTKFWMHNDVLHRTTGPAIEWSNNLKEYFLGGKWLSKQSFDALGKNK